MYEKQMELFEDGGLRDEGGMVDKESGNEVPVGSTRKEVRDDIPAMLSEGEFVFPADVVRYIGLENLMRIRQDAKQGLKQMEAMGQMGNGDEAVLPDDMPFGMMDLIIVEGEQEEPQEKAHGGVIHAQQGTFVTPIFDPSNQDVREYKNDKGVSLFIPFLNGDPVYPIPAGYFPAGQMTTETKVEEATSKSGVDEVGKDYTLPESEFQKAGGWYMDTTDPEKLEMWLDEAEKVTTAGNVAAGFATLVGGSIFGAAVALANKHQKSIIEEMIDEKIEQARNTPIAGQVAKGTAIKDRFDPDKKSTLANAIVEATKTLANSLGLTKEEKAKVVVGAATNANQDTKESDKQTEKAIDVNTKAVEILGVTAEQIDSYDFEQAAEKAVQDLGVTASNEDLAKAIAENYEATAPNMTFGGPTSRGKAGRRGRVSEPEVELESGPAAPVAPETPEAIPTTPELPVDLAPSNLPTTPTGISVPTDTPFTAPEEVQAPSSLSMRTGQQVVAAGMTQIQTALDDLRASMSYRGPVTGMTIEEKIEDPIAPFQKGWQALTNAISEVTSTDYTPPSEPSPDDGGEGPSISPPSGPSSTVGTTPSGASQPTATTGGGMTGSDSRPDDPRGEGQYGGQSTSVSGGASANSSGSTGSSGGMSAADTAAAQEAGKGYAGGYGFNKGGMMQKPKKKKKKPNIYRGIAARK